MQKLVTIYLDSIAYSSGKWIQTSNSEMHGVVEEHLQEELKAGWSIVSVSGFGGAADTTNARGWLAVVLEKSA